MMIPFSAAGVRRMPAEWDPHESTWISWPHNPETWPGLLPEAGEAMAAFVAAVAGPELVRINVLNQEHATQVANILGSRVDLSAISLEQIPTDDAWIRDYGAIIVRDAEAGWLAVDFDYNAWGGKYPPYDQDQAVAAQMAERLNVGRVVVPMVLEGGSVDVNGEGLGLVTEQCLLNPNRNPGMTREEIAAVLAEFLGLNDLVWLGDGVSGDDTDGHIDNLARFVDRRRVVCILPDDRADPDFPALAENRRRLAEFRDSEGSLELIELPTPDPVMHEGQRLPASYANFYIANEVVAMPAYGCKADDKAAGILGDCFPGRRIVPVDCRRLIVGLGSLHCLTQQIPVMVPGSGK